jgi:hypothetical protein
VTAFFLKKKKKKKMNDDLSDYRAAESLFMAKEMA